MAEKITPYTRQDLKRLRNLDPQKGYPSLEKRLVMSRLQLGKMALSGGIAIPYGPWFVNSHKNRKNVDPALLDPIVTSLLHPATPEQTQRWQQEGYLIDTARGLPLHPRFKQLIRTTGMYAGPGFSYRYGPQRATNLGVRVAENDTIYYALTKAHSRDVWGLPGGYQDADESLLAGAFREAYEEAGIVFPDDRQQELTIASHSLPPSGFRRDTMHSWMEQYFHFVQAQEVGMDRQAFGELTTHDPKEIEEIRWFTLQEIQEEVVPIMRSHREEILRNELILAA